MSTPTANIPSWATDANFASGPDVGYPTRLEPSEAVKGQGYVGKTKISAQTDNWRAGATSDWLRYLSPIQLRNWHAVLPAYRILEIEGSATSLQPYAAYSGFWWVGATNNQLESTGSVVVIPANTSTSGDLRGHSEIMADGAKRISSVAISESGVVVAAGDHNDGATTTVVWVGTTTGGTLTAVTIDNYVYVPIKVVWTGLYFLALPAHGDAITSGAEYWFSPDGTNWYEDSFNSIGITATLLHCVVGLPETVAMGFCDSSVVLVSSDSGDNWTVTDTGDTGTCTVGLCWTGAGWMAIGADNKLRQLVGSTWVEIGTISGLPEQGGSYYTSDRGYWGNMLASDGSRALVRPVEVDGAGLSVAWSLDLGTTWTTEPIAHTFSSGHRYMPRGVCYGGGEFLLLADGPNSDGDAYISQVWASLRL
jgi:hypothetical protein